MAAEEEDVGCELLHWTRELCQREEAQVQELRGLGVANVISLWLGRLLRAVTRLF